MDYLASKGVALNIDDLIYDRYGVKVSPAPSPVLSTKSQSYIRIYTASSKTKHTDRKEAYDTEKTPSNILAIRHRMPIVDSKYFMNQEKDPQSIKKLEIKIGEAQRNLSQAKSDFLDIKRDISTYEYEYCNKACLETTLIRISTANSNLPLLIQNLQTFQNQTDKYLDLITTKFNQIHNLTTGNLEPINKTYSKEDLCIRSVSNYSKLQLAFQSIISISGLYCSLQIMTNSLYTTILAIVLLPSGLTLRTTIDKKLIISSVNDLKTIIQSFILPKLFLTFNRDELFLS